MLARTSTQWLGAWRLKMGLLAGCALGLLVCGARTARAADPAEEGRTLFEAGVEAYEKEKYAAAVAVFERAYELTARPGLLFSIAQAHRKSFEKDHKPEQLREAIRYYTRYLATSPSGEHRTEAVSWLDKLKDSTEARGWEQTSEAQTELAVTANIPGAKLAVDGVGALALPLALKLGPGPHHIRVTADGYANYERDVELRSGATLPLHVQLERLTATLEIRGNNGAEVFVDGVSVGRLPSPGFTVPPGAHSLELRQVGHYTLQKAIVISGSEPIRLDLSTAPTVRHTVSWVAVAAGAAATLAGGVLGYLALQKQSDARKLQDQPGMTAAFDDAIKARNQLRLGAILSASVGAGAVLGGTISLVTEGYGPELPASSTTARLAVPRCFGPSLAVSGAF